jgi:hypothetical protein
MVTTAALALLLFSQPAKAADDDVVQSSARQIEKICGKLSEVLAAKTSIPLPVAKVRMGKMHLPYVSGQVSSTTAHIHIYAMLMFRSTLLLFSPIPASLGLAMGSAGHACPVSFRRA